MGLLIDIMCSSQLREREVGGLATLLIGGVTAAGAIVAVTNGLDHLPLNWMMNAQEIQSYVTAVQAGEDLLPLEIFYGGSNGMIPSMMAYGADLLAHGLLGGVLYRTKNE